MWTAPARARGTSGENRQNHLVPIVAVARGQRRVARDRLHVALVNEVRLHVMRPRARRTTLAVALLVWIGLTAIVLLADHETQFTCERKGAQGSCAMEKIYPVGSTSETFPLGDIRDVRVASQTVKGNTTYWVKVDVSTRLLDASIAAFRDAKAADAERDELKAFLADPTKKTFGHPLSPSAMPTLTPVFVVSGFALLTVLLLVVNALQSATVTIDRAKRKLRVVRRYVVWRSTAEMPLDDARCATLEEKTFTNKSGKRFSAGRIWIMNEREERALLVHPKFGDPDLCRDAIPEIDRAIASAKSA